MKLENKDVKNASSNFNFCKINPIVMERFFFFKAITKRKKYMVLYDMKAVICKTFLLH